VPLRKPILCLLVALAAPIAARADGPPQPVPADGQCTVPADPGWTKQEQFVWLTVCAGKEADFNKEPDYGGDLDPMSPAGLPDSRILRPSFLETILLKDKYRTAVTRFGVRIAGARFQDVVDLRNAELAHDLWLDRSLFEKGADIQGIKTSRRITFDRSKILGGLNAVRARIDQDLTMHRAEISGDVNLLRAYVGNELNLNGATVSGEIGLNTADIGRTLMMRDKGHFNRIDLGFAHVGSLEFNGSTVTGVLNMNGIRIDQSLFMRDKAQLNAVELTSAHIGGKLELGSSTVTGVLNMNGIRVDQDLLMRDKAQFDTVNLGAAHIGGNLELNSSTVAGSLDMNGIRVDQDLFMYDKAQFNTVELTAAHIGGTLELNGSAVTGLLGMDGIQVDLDVIGQDKAAFKNIRLVAARIGGALHLSGSTIDGDLDLNRASIGSQLNLIGSTVTGVLNLNAVRIGQNLHMEGKARFAEINLIGGHISGQLSLNSSAVSGKLLGSYIDVEQTAFLGATFEEPVTLASAKFGQDLYLSGGNFKANVNLTGAQINSVLVLASTHWLNGATLNLTNGSAGGIDLSDSWPDNIYLNGFTYRNLSNLSKYNSEQATTWFGKQAYAPQPYEQLATVLQANGLIDEATDIRYAGKDREYRAATGLRRVWLFLLKYSIGFGYHLEYAFAWVLGFVLLGWAVLYATGQRSKHGTTLGLAYSFDMLLPLVQLDKKHDDVALDSWPQRYFYAHKIVGVLLTSFIVAGISGLTK
jgi:hypothetical protein